MRQVRVKRLTYRLFSGIIIGYRAECQPFSTSVKLLRSVLPNDEGDAEKSQGLFLLFIRESTVECSLAAWRRLRLRHFPLSNVTSVPPVRRAEHHLWTPQSLLGQAEEALVHVIVRVG